MRPLAVPVACGLVVGWLGLHASPSPTTPQATFRAAVDIVDVDVSVLDRNRLPIRGLTADDFTVLEDGERRPIAAFSAVDLPSRARPSAEWVTAIAPDVQSNEFPREGRLVVILMDRTIGMENLPAAVGFAEAAVDQLRPGDMAAVAYSTLGVPQNFTSDRSRLLAAIRQPVMGLPDGDSGSPGECLCGACSLETVTGIADALLPVRQRRKVLFIIGTNIAIQSTGMCSGLISNLRQRAIRSLQAANVTVHAFDPTGLQSLVPQAASSLTNAQVAGFNRSAVSAAMQRRANVSILPDHTGGRVVSDPVRPADQAAALLRESASYYVLGFVPTAPANSRRFHRIEVEVNRRDVSVQARHGYYGPAATMKDVVPRKTVSRLPPILRTAVEGLWPRTDIALAIAAAPIARPKLDQATVATIVSARQEWEGPPRTLLEPPGPTTVNVLVGAFDRRGEAVASARQTVSLTPRAAGARAFEYEIITHLDLRPGRYEVRAAIEDTALGRSGSVYTYVDVPNYRQQALDMSGLLVEAVPAPPSGPADALRELVAVVPTARRAFARSDRATAFVRIYQGLTRTVTPGYVIAQVVDEQGRTVFNQESRVLAEQFGASRALDYYVDLPLARLPPGAYLLSIEARSGSEVSRRDARFEILP